MKELTDEVFREAVDLIERLRSGELDDDALGAIAVRLRTLLPDPYFMDYTVDHEPELEPEEVVRKAFQYRPIQL